MDKTIFYALVAGLTPAIFWIYFWMQEDNDDLPEPKSLIAATFVFGGLAALISLAIQAFLINTHILVNKTEITIITFAFIEESLKFLAVYKIALATKFNNERMDPVLYMIIGALGFAAVENIFYLIDYIHDLKYIQSLIDGGYRFVGSTIVHIISSGFVGLGCAILYFKKRNIKIISLLLASLVAIVMHSLFNFFVNSGSKFYNNIAFYSSWAVVVILLLIFEFLRHDMRVRPRSNIRHQLEN